MRDGLLIGASAEDGEVVQLLEADASGEGLEACVQFYDYLEVQPIENVLFRKEDRKENRMQCRCGAVTLSSRSLRRFWRKIRVWKK